MSRTSHARPAGRIIRIMGEGHRGIVAVRRSPSLKQALLDHYRDALSGKGFTKPHVVGNTLTVRDKFGNERMYSALEAK